MIFRQTDQIVKIAGEENDGQTNRLPVGNLLRGLGKGHRGKCHRAAIALGLKPDPKTLKRAA